MSTTMEPMQAALETVWMRSPVVLPAQRLHDADVPAPEGLGGSIRGKRVGLRTEGAWTSWLLIVDEWSKALEADGAIPVVLRANGSRIGADAAATQAGIDEWAASLDLGISGLGTCGSCTAYTVLDGVAIDRAGKPAAVAITEEFVPHARSVAEHVGNPNVQVLVFPHPLEGRPTEELQAIAAEYYPRFLALLGRHPMSTDLQAPLLEVAGDPMALLALSLEQGWGDGMPVIAPTDERVSALLSASSYAPDHVLGLVPPRYGAATVESVAINAVLAGVEPAAFPLVVAAIEGVLAEDWAAVAITTTTSGAHPMTIVNGPKRDELGIDYQGCCLGGAGGRGSGTIGRAVSLVLRNVGGQRANDSTKSVFGQPSRLGGLCFGEWEERSPWPSLAERRGFSASQEVVTVHAGIGTHAMYDDHNTEPRDKAYAFAKGMAYMCNSCLQSGSRSGEFVLLLNPVHAARLAKEFTTVEDFQAYTWEHAWQPLDTFLPAFQTFLQDGHATVDGHKVRLAEHPEQIVPVVCGGLGSHQAVLLNSFGHSLMQSNVPQRS